MGKLFEIRKTDKKNPVIIPKEECWIIKPLRDVIENYPEEYPKIIAYLHFMHSYRPDDNPYADVPFEEREEQILRELELDINSEDVIIKEASECIEKKYETTFYALYTGMKEYLNKMGKLLKTTAPTLDGKDSNAANVRQFIKEYNALSVNFKQAYRDFDEEVGNSRLRGGGKAAYDEDDEDILN